MNRLATFCCDVGSTRSGRFGWVRACEVGTGYRVIGNDSIADCARMLDADVRAGHVVTLGFESPLFIPVPTDERES